MKTQRQLTPERLREQIQAGDLAITKPDPPENMGPRRSRQFKARVRLAIKFFESDKSFTDMAKLSQRRGWTDSPVLTRQAAFAAINKAAKWMSEHGCFRVIERETHE